MIDVKIRLLMRVRLMNFKIADFREILSYPFFYALYLKMIIRSNNHFVRHDLVQPAKNDFIVDIGCGPATILKVPSDVTYLGLDISKKYISYAKKNIWR